MSNTATILASGAAVAALMIPAAAGAATLVVPLTLVAVGAGVFQFIADKKGWTIDDLGNIVEHNLTNLEYAEAISMAQQTTSNPELLNPALNSVGISTSDAGNTFLVPQVDESGHLIGSIQMKPTNIEDLGKGLTRYTFENGAQLKSQAPSYYDNELGETLMVVPADDVYNVWNLPIPGGGTATFSLSDKGDSIYELHPRNNQGEYSTNTITTGPDGTINDYKLFSANGQLLSETITKTSADGNIINTINHDGNCEVLNSSTDITTTDSIGNIVNDNKQFDANGILISETITNTSNDYKTVSITNMDGNGNIINTCTRQTTVDETGAITYDNKEFDANGILTGETITSICADYTVVTTTNLDGSGNILNSSTDITTTDLGGNTTRNYREYNANGTLAYDSTTTENADGTYINYQTTYGSEGGYQQSWQASDGSHGENDQSVDGSTLNSRLNADGSSTTNTYDAASGVYGYNQVNADGTYINYQTTYDSEGGYQQSWQASDGSHGENDQSADGSTLNSHTEADGSSVISTNDGQGNLTTDYYLSDGRLASESWASSDGTSGIDTFSYNADGSYNDNWSQNDGSHGSINFDPDGSYAGTDYNPDGSYSVYTGDMQGNYSGENYSAEGLHTGDSWQKADGSYGSSTYNSDGTFSVTTYVPHGGIDGISITTTNNYDANGQLVSDNWTSRCDYSGQDTFTYNTDGSVEKISFTTNGSDYSENRDKITKSDGSYTETWSTNDGDYGTSSYNSVTGELDNTTYSSFDGSTYSYSKTYTSNGSMEENSRTTYSDGTWNSGDIITESDGSYAVSRTQSDGSYYDFSYDVATGSYESANYSPQNGETVSYSHTVSDTGAYEDINTTIYDDGSYSTEDKMVGPDGSYEDIFISEHDGNSYCTDTIYNTDDSKIWEHDIVFEVFDGYTINSDETYSADGTYDETMTRSYDDGSWITENTYYTDDGSHSFDWTSNDGSYGYSSYDAETGLSEAASYDASIDTYYSYDYNEDDFYSDPLVLNLAGEPVRTTSLKGSNTTFDMLDNGQQEKTGWITQDEGFLVEDANGDGVINSVAEMFSAKTSSTAHTGFGALSELDTNQDGTVDNKDSDWSKLQVWVDSNSDGLSNGDELFNLDQLDIAAINLNRVELGREDNGNFILGVSTFTRTDGSQGDIAEISFHYDTTDSRSTALQSQTNMLISAMAAFAPSAAGQITLSQAENRQEHSIIAASMQKAA